MMSFAKDGLSYFFSMLTVMGHVWAAMGNFLFFVFAYLSANEREKEKHIYEQWYTGRESGKEGREKMYSGTKNRRAWLLLGNDALLL